MVTITGYLQEEPIVGTPSNICGLSPPPSNNTRHCPVGPDSRLPIWSILDVLYEFHLATTYLRNPLGIVIYLRHT